ncbi:uncharacterized protein LOC126311255 [Schistocerca gregaria]|uniref:uncharacterized protein LOC126311255 n=1 Tax=Schistocerca gregaria TaxID=7010 RepID=UPI00211EFBDF|nr:uncharacterized protein LOC126311255 [Schistocerca gregaria]
MCSQVSGWYFTKEELMRPVKPNGTDYESANRYRKEMYKFMIGIGSILKVPQLTISTAAVYFHRFYARKDFSDYDRHEVALVCFFLAAKVEETHAKLRDVIAAGWSMRYKEPVSMDSNEYNAIRDRLLVLERVVLQTITFDLSIEHPYKFVLEQAKQLWGQTDHREFAQTAWNFVNDSHMSVVCLQFRPAAIASAAIYLASKIHNVKLPDINNKPWWEVLNVNMSELEDISSQILDVFDQPLPSVPLSKNNAQPKSPSADTKKDATETKANEPPSAAQESDSSKPSTAQEATRPYHPPEPTRTPPYQPPPPPKKPSCPPPPTSRPPSPPEKSCSPAHQKVV